MPRLGIPPRVREFALASLAVLLLIAPVWAHVGNPDVYFQGTAGPYHLIITIRTPQMIPGTAGVEILSATPGISKITVVPLYIVGPGAKYPPVGDLLAQSIEDPQYFSGKIWLMESGSWQVRGPGGGAQGAGGRGRGGGWPRRPWPRRRAAPPADAKIAWHSALRVDVAAGRRAYFHCGR